PMRLAAPNLFILGAAKCGTTSLHYALSQHPEIHLSSIKEPSFFSRRPLDAMNPIDYFNLFPYQSGKMYYGEASHANFSSPEAAPILRQLFPDAKFLLILRNPVRRAHALYHHLFRHGEEQLTSFEQALEEEDKRFHDGRFRDTSRTYFWNYMYVRSSRYDLQLERYLGLFPKEQFFVFTLGEWKSDPQRWLREVFRFLKVDSDIQVDAEPRNQASGYEPMSETTHQLLTEKLAGVRERVETLIGRRLDHWEY
ncbi:MAG: sulfotransferase, partial [bacterium]